MNPLRHARSNHEHYAVLRVRLNLRIALGRHEGV